LVPVDPKTGLRTSGGYRGILEAFKPGTAPPDASQVIGYGDNDNQNMMVTPEADRAVRQGNGLY
jgi:penicillin-binding protein 1A